MPLSLVVLLVMALTVLMPGCGPTQRPAAPEPEIKVERTETTNGASIIVRYVNHDMDSAGNVRARVVLDSPEKLQQYKKQVLFLLNQLDEAEKRSNVHEPPTPPK
jgi:hypothetical protein